MSEKQYTSPDDLNQELASKLAGLNRLELAGFLAHVYGLEAGDLEVLEDMSFQIPEKPNNVYFRVLHAKSNTMYGVIAELQEDGSINNYRCGVIPL